MNTSLFREAECPTEQGLHRSRHLCFLHVAVLLSCNENEIWREKNILIEFVVPIESSMKLIKFFLSLRSLSSGKLIRFLLVLLLALARRLSSILFCAATKISIQPLNRAFYTALPKRRFSSSNNRRGALQLHFCSNAITSQFTFSI